MLTNLDFINEGMPFPPPSEGERLARYERNEALFEGRHDEVYNDLGRLNHGDGDDVIQTVFNFPARSTKLFADLLLGDEPLYRIKDRNSTGVAGQTQETPRPPGEVDPDSVPGSPETPVEAPQEGQEAQAQAGGGLPTDPNASQDPAQDQGGTDPSGAGAEAEDPRADLGINDVRQTALDDLIDRTDFNVTAYETFLDVPRFGDSLFRIRAEEGEAVIEGQSPKYWFPVVSPNNVRKILYHVLAWTYERLDPLNVPFTDDVPIAERMTRYLRVEIHAKGTVEHRLYEMNKNGVGDLGSIKKKLTSGEASRIEADWPAGNELEETGVDDFLVIHAPGFRTSDRLFGFDDYSDLDSALQEFEIRHSQISRVLDRHVDPNMAGPPVEMLTVTHIDGTESEVMIGGGRYFQMDPEYQGKPPEFIIWDAKLDVAFEQCDKLLDQLYFVSETSPAAFGFQKEGLAESGSALRRLLMAPLIKTRRLAMRFKRSMARTLEIAGQVESVAAKRMMTPAPQIGGFPEVAGLPDEVETPFEGGVSLAQGEASETPTPGATGGTVVPFPTPGRQITENGQVTTSIFGGIEIEFRDGLPRDEAEEATIVGGFIDKNLMSRRSGMQRLFSMDRGQADAELAQIGSEARESIARQQAALGVGSIGQVINRRPPGGGGQDGETRPETRPNGRETATG